MRPKTEKMKLCEQGVIREEALLAYIRNELTAEEKQELEKLLKEDPFAQEALEGLQESNKTNTAAIVLNINNKVKERAGLKEKKMIQLHWSNYAWAAVVFGILIGVGFLMVTFLSRPDDKMAMNTKAKEEPANAMEQKPAQPSLVPAAGGAMSDSTILSEAQKNSADAAPVSVNPLSELKKADESNALQKNANTNEGKNVLTVPTGAAQRVTTGTGGATTPSAVYNNSTILADDKGTAPAKPISTSATAGNKAADKEDVKAKDNRAANAEVEMERMKTKSASKSSNAQQEGAPAAQIVVRGSIIEKEEAEKVTVITMDDAMKSFNNGDYKKSSEQFGEILKQQPNNTDALYFGGISDYINGNTKKSEKNFDKLLKDGTKFNEGSKWYKANILLKKGKKDEARKLLEELASSGGSYKERAIKKKAEMEF